MSKITIVDDNGNAQDIILPSNISLTITNTHVIETKVIGPLYPATISVEGIAGWTGRDGYTNSIAPNACGAPDGNYGTISSLHAGMQSHALGPHSFLGAAAPVIGNITGVEISFVGMFCPNATDTDYVQLSQVVPCYNVVNDASTNVVDTPLKLTADAKTFIFGGPGNMLGLDPKKLSTVLAGSYFRFVGVNFAVENKSAALMMQVKLDAVSLKLYYEGDTVTVTPSVPPAPIVPKPTPTPTSPPPPPPSTGGTSGTPVPASTGVGIKTEAIALGMAVAYQDYSTPPDGVTIKDRAWTFGDDVGTASNMNGQYLYTKPGTYDVTETITYSDNTTATETIRVNIGLTPLLVVDGLSIVYHIDSNQFVEGVDWDFDDGEHTIGGGIDGTGADGRHSYSNSGAYNVSGIVRYKNTQRADSFGPVEVTI